jgi:hypothetical protein
LNASRQARRPAKQQPRERLPMQREASMAKNNLTPHNGMH